MEVSQNYTLNWSAHNVAIVQKGNYSFGLGEEQMEQLMSFLLSKGFNLPAGEEIGFTLHHVKATIICLKERGLFEPDFKAAVENLLESVLRERELEQTGGQNQEPVPEPGQEYNQQPGVEDLESIDALQIRTNKPGISVSETQLILRSLMSPEPPFTVIIDGRWGSLTDRAFATVMQSYNLRADVNPEAMELLKTISERVVRIYCKSESIIKSVKQNPFCIIHSDGNEFELTSKGILRRMDGKKELLRFTSMPSKYETTAFAFNAFSAWFMLLNMKGSQEGDRPGQFEYDSDFFKPDLSGPFVIEPQIVVQFTPASAPVPMHFDVSRDEEYIVVLFSKSMGIKIFPGFPGSSQRKQGFFEFGNFYSEELLGNSKEVETIANGDFLKFFVVKKDWVKNVSTTQISNPAGVEMNEDFYNLITASKESILRTTLVGIILKTENAPSENFEKRVEKLYDAQPVTIEDDLQKNRWGGKAENNSRIIKAGAKRLAPWTYAVTVTVESTARARRLAGKVAFFMHNTFPEEIRYETAVKGKAIITFTAYETFTIGAYTEDGTMLELDLNEVTGLPRGFYYRDVSKNFKKQVESLYRRRPVTVKSDLQKNRWGGKSINGGKVLVAEVEKTRLTLNYKVTIRVRSENSARPLKGDVAFFMHDSFTEIKYRKAINGEATVIVHAYEDFTVGAFTEDGTMLELDLNSVKGYPEGFYYKQKENK